MFPKFEYPWMTGRRTGRLNLNYRSYSMYPFVSATGEFVSTDGELFEIKTSDSTQVDKLNDQKMKYICDERVSCENAGQNSGVEKHYELSLPTSPDDQGTPSDTTIVLHDNLSETSLQSYYSRFDPDLINDASYELDDSTGIFRPNDQTVRLAIQSEEHVLPLATNNVSKSSASPTGLSSSDYTQKSSSFNNAVQNANAAVVPDDSCDDPLELPDKSKTYCKACFGIVSSVAAGTFDEKPKKLPPIRLAPFQSADVAATSTGTTSMTVERHRKLPKTVDSSTQTDNPPVVVMNHYIKPLGSNEPISVREDDSVNITQQTLQLYDVDADHREQTTAMDCPEITRDCSMTDTNENVIEEAPLLETVAARGEENHVDNDNNSVTKPKYKNDDDYEGGCYSCLMTTADWCSIV